MDDQFPIESDRIIVVRYFTFESEARLYAARLKEAELPHFLSNANMNNTLPLSPGGVGLHVKQKDKEEALRILVSVDELRQQTAATETYHEADHDDIAYYKSLNAPPTSNTQWLLIAVGTLIVLLVLRALARALGWVETWRDFF
ncbi:MAG: hypothetical protein AAF798_22365 [Bacteroidota bacterium]